MFRRSDLHLMAMALGAVLLLRPIAAADDVTSFLERLGLTDLLAAHLEHELRFADESERQDLMAQLAGVYAQLLERTAEPESQADLMQRGRELLAMASHEQTDELRLALLRATYRGAEATVENHRLRLSSVEDIERATTTLTELIPQLSELRDRLKKRVDDVARRLGRAAGADAVLLAEEQRRVDRLYAQCTFLNAWSLYYQAWLSDRREAARVAEPLFAILLQTESSAPLPDEVSVDLRATEVIARTILGMALCKSITASSSMAEQWLDLLALESTYEPLRRDLPAWRLVIQFEHGEYGRAMALWEQLQADGNTIPLPWVRLVAVHALEASRPQREAEELARLAITELASRGELEQVFDLGRRYGLDALGDSGFAVQYVRAVEQYHQARSAHGDEKPATDRALIDQYGSVVTRLRTALDQNDAQVYPAASANAQLLIGWCLYFRSEFLEARAAFEQSADALTSDQAAEALWMAIVSLDRAAQAGRRGADAELASLIDRFLRDFPSNEHAPQLRLRRALATGEPSENAVQELLAIPPNSDVYHTSRQQAANMLYRLFRDAPAHRRVDLGNRYLVVAVPLLSAQAEALTPSGATDAQWFVVHCRYVLDVALREEIQRLEAARQALRWLDDAKDHNAVDWKSIELEVEFRRLTERLYSGDEPAAVALADAMHQSDSQSPWTRQASRAIFKLNHDRWQSESKETPPPLATLESIVRFGGRIIDEYELDSTALDRPGVMSYYLAVAQAQMAWWERTLDAERAAAAKALYEKLLAHRPRDAGFLRSVAILAEALGQLDRAADGWRLLASGADPASESALFYEAKFRLISILERTDPTRAREVMDQHRLLYPQFGPEPWGARLRELDQRLPAKTDASVDHELPDEPEQLSDEGGADST